MAREAEQPMPDGLERGQRDAFGLLMRENNRRLWRIARAILNDESDAEEAVQEAFMRAFAHLGQFRGEASPGTWLSRIVVNEALKLRAQRARSVNIDDIGEPLQAESGAACIASPEHDSARSELRRMIEQAIDGLAVSFRTVFVMRVVEGMSTEETARCLGIHPITVRTRFYRASRQLRAALGGKLAGGFEDAFPFAGARCERLMRAVFARLGLDPPGA